MRSALAQTGRRLAAAFLDNPASFKHSTTLLESIQPISLKNFAPTLASHFSLPHRWLPSRPFSTQPPSSPTPSSTYQDYQKLVLYRGRGIQLFRILVRFKIFQLTGIAALAVPITTFLNNGEVSSMQAVIASSLLIGSGMASTALWYYSRRYLGELSLLEPLQKPSSISTATASAPKLQPKVRFSVLDFWGNRENVDVDLHDVIPPLAGLPPAAAAVAAAEPFLPITASGDRQYIVSLRYGIIMDKERLKSLLYGDMHESTN